MSGLQQARRYGFPRLPKERVERRRFRREAMLEQGNRCFWCGHPLNALTVTADHIKAASRGGKTVRRNIVAACVRCNRLKSAMTKAEFKAALRGFTTAGMERVRDVEISWALSAFGHRVKRAVDRMERRLQKATRGAT